MFRNTCPRNCYGTCSMLSYTENGKLIKVAGDPMHGFTQGHLCAKGYAYTQYVYNPLRLKYPMMQTKRGSGNWVRISWEEAYRIIAEKIIELYDRYGSNLASGYNKFSGNLGLLHYAVEGMFNSIGPHTKSFGNLCLATGEQAVKESFGNLHSPVPEEMAQSKMIFIWGANPAVTNIHQMKFIYKAKKNGGKLVVIDPIYTETASKADLYIQIKPGTDALLALGIAKCLLGLDQIEKTAAEWNGWKDYQQVLKRLNLATVAEKTGVSIETIQELAALYGEIKPVTTWNGLGIQRNKYGGVSIQAINSLAALSGNLHIANGGVYFTHSNYEDFPMNLLNFPEKKHASIKSSRMINCANFAMEAKNLQDPPLKLLWIASRSPLSQDMNINVWQELFKELELIVTVDLFMTNTAKHSDIVLPAASHFEEEDLNVGYWHHWLSINQKAIPSFYETKSDLMIARELTKKLNMLRPGFSTFPYELEPKDWIELELNEKVQALYGLKSYTSLVDGPKPRLANQKKNKHFSFIQVDDVKTMLHSLLLETKGEPSPYPFRLLSPQTLLKIHSQFALISWLNPKPDETVIEINNKVAESLGINDGEKVKIHNENGAIIAKACKNQHLPHGVVLVSQTGENSINQLIGSQLQKQEELSSTHFYDCFVSIKSLKHP
ncbi:molybdopterin-dependent oxidoreductase [Robertmurraya siralis]|uniref:molybdopterin-dependent oxidoreductase n=1 Tax=Robertmurraya siralis TaxID=77777 RepID=UPI001F3525AE|nr:molybdopterin-dependent oxidoreductase [Robertmurraya siralis]